ncbi:MAG: tetratricopeptide repeat protein [Sphingobacteriales bacterium]|nr:MAG: tetratricopeptide repeat protein [Sphingobacteriales bacterium]TAF79782.1 MAG: tetratricopeptide repeat protein [Sphingobacteriales bacterium]
MPINRLEKLLEFATAEPNDAFLKYALATEYLRLNETDKALEYYLNLTKNHPNYVGTYYHLGKLYETLNQKPAALEVYQTGMNVAKNAKDQHALNELMGVFNMLRDEMEE